jgi:hypothetical protein
VAHYNAFVDRRYFLLGALGLPAARLEAQLPAPMEAFRGIHPRLFLTAERLAAIRSGISGPLAAQWAVVKRNADSFVRQGLPRYDDVSDPEMLWQREVGNKQPFLAMAWLLTGDPVYLKAAQEWCLASCGYPLWGTGTRDGTDLAAGHQLLGLALVYDWLFDALDPAAKSTIRRTLLRRGAQMAPAVDRRTSYLQNHLWVDACGLAAAGMALYDEPDASAQAISWAALALTKFRRTEDVLGPDGASHEGVPYWTYGVEYMLKFWALAADLIGEDLSNPWWTSTAMYRLYNSLPRAAWTRTNLLVDIADAPRYDWYGPEFLLRRLAARYGDPYAQWLALELERGGMTQYSAAWLNLLWYDTALAPQPPAGLPTLRHFSDMDLVCARSGWDGGESLLVFKCGPPIGHDAMPKFTFDPGSGHVHPDAGHFVLFGAGEWLIRDDGYMWKQTDQHNTLLIDGAGQLGEGAQWFQGIQMIRAASHPRVIQATSTPDLDELAGDAAPAYPAASGLRRFVRRLLFLKPDVLIVVDEIETDRARNLELRFHPENRGAIAAGGAFAARGKTAALRLDPLTADGVRVTAADVPSKDRSGNPAVMYTLRLETSRDRWRNAVALSWAPLDQAPATVTLEQSGSQWIFRAGARTAVVNWG